MACLCVATHKLRTRALTHLFAVVALIQPGKCDVTTIQVIDDPNFLLVPDARNVRIQLAALLDAVIAWEGACARERFGRARVPRHATHQSQMDEASTMAYDRAPLPTVRHSTAV